MSNKTIGFEFILNVKEIDSIKPRQSGQSKGQDGNEIKWGHGVKFKTRNLDLVEDDEYGIKEVEKTLEVTILCDTKDEVIQLNKYLLGIKADARPFSITTTLPNKVSTDEYSCKSLTSGKDFMNSNKK